jgi:ketose-bisphosphate aldolase
MEAAMALTDLPVVLHLDHGQNFEICKEVIDGGFTSVMIDGSKLPFAENIALSKEAAKIAHDAGVTLEAEIGHVPFGDGEIELSTAAEADEFVGKTGVDALAISIGTIHGFYKKAPVLDIKRAAEIGSKVAIPLVLHGGTGVPEDQLKLAVGCGVAKVNIATELQSIFLKGVAAEIAVNGDKFKPLDLYFKPAEQKVFDFVRAKIRSLR